MDLGRTTYVVGAASLISLLLFIIRLVLVNTIHDFWEWLFFSMAIGLFIVTIFVERAYFEEEKAKLAERKSY